MTTYKDCVVKGIALNPVVKTDTRTCAVAECKARGIKLTKTKKSKKKKD
jgi:hypothetical protein